MSDIISILKKVCSKTFCAIITSLCRVVLGAFSFIEGQQKRKDQKEERKQTAKDNVELKDICDNGTLDDLLKKRQGAK